MENQKNNKKILFAIIGVIVIAAVIIVAVIFGNQSKKSDKKEEAKTETKEEEDVIITIGDEKFSLSDIMYYVYTEEENGALYDQIYLSFYGESYWNMEDEENDNKTGEQLAKENIIASVKQDSIFYQEALKAGYSLTEEDKEIAQSNYDEFCSYLNEDQKKVSGMGDELLEYFQRQEVIAKYEENMLAESDYDYDKVTSSVSKEECREYDYEYYCIYKTDDEDNEYPAATMKKYLTTLNDLQSQLTADTDMASLLTDDMTTYIEYSDDYIVEQDGEAYGTYKGVDCDAAIKALKNGEVSDVIETDFAYYVFRMSDNNSTEYYDEMLDEAVTSAKNEVFNTLVSQLSPSYNIVLNEDTWNNIVIGSLIYDDSAEYDYSEEEEDTTSDESEDSEPIEFEIE